MVAKYTAGLQDRPAGHAEHPDRRRGSADRDDPGAERDRPDLHQHAGRAGRLHVLPAAGAAARESASPTGARSCGSRSRSCPRRPPFAIDWDGRSNVESLQFSFDGFKKTQFVVLIKLDDVPVPIPIPVPDVTPLSPPLGQQEPDAAEDLAAHRAWPATRRSRRRSSRWPRRRTPPTSSAARARSTCCATARSSRAHDRPGAGRRNHLRRRLLRRHRHPHDQARAPTSRASRCCATR